MRETIQRVYGLSARGAGVPKRLYYQGDWTLIQTPCIAIVGTRAPTAAASEATFCIAAAFAQEGFTIVSGLAKGIDKAAHLGALSVGGKTVAVLGTPLFQCYPKEHSTLMAAIGRRGLLLTEYRDRVFEPRRFSDRDRLQAALSLAVLPAQTRRAVPGEKQRPGTLYTIEAALAYRRLLIVPTPRKEDYQKRPDAYGGCQDLLAEGKALQLSTTNFPRIVALLKECFVQEVAASVALS